MAHYQVILAYDGTGFSGFQRQTNNQTSAISPRTVQAEVESALRRLGWSGTTILAAGRTDAGVHASGQVITFDMDWRHDTTSLQAALNANLPPDVAAHGVHTAADDFHPRYDALLRRYRYRLFCSPTRDPLRERYAWRVWPALDMDLLHASAAAIVGEHDFVAFGSPPKPGGPTVRSVEQAAWLSEPADGWMFEIAANAFLYHMVRRLVGYQAAIAQGREDPQAVRLKLQAQEPVSPGSVRVRTLAPAHGLTLVEVVYPLADHPLASLPPEGSQSGVALREDAFGESQ
jgi:tRNA pseudouridine38-40 synthase